MSKMIIRTWLTNITTKLLSVKIKIKHLKNRGQPNSAASRTFTDNISIVFKEEISQSMITRHTSPNKIIVSTTSMSINRKLTIHISRHLIPNLLIKYRTMPMIRSNLIRIIPKMLKMRR